MDSEIYYAIETSHEKETFQDSFNLVSFQYAAIYVAEII